MKILRNIAIAIAALVVVLFVAGIIVVQTSWFRDYVKQRIIASIENSTGAKVEIQSFNFQWTHLQAAVTGVVLHGKEPAGSPPFLRVARVRANIRLFADGHLWNIAAMEVEQPWGNVIVYSDGRTNIPTPPKPSSSQSPLATVVNLAIGHFDIANGQITFADRKYDFNARGNNLRVQLAFDTRRDQYQGQLSLQPLYVVSGRNTPVDLTVRVPLLLARDKIEVQGAQITSPRSTLAFNASVTDLRNPHVSARVDGQIAVADIRNAANVPLRSSSNLPSTLDVKADASATRGSVQVANLRLTIGQSNLAASGSLSSGLDFTSRLALGQLASLGGATTHPTGVASVNGVAKLTPENNLDLKQLKAAAFGAEFTGDASLEQFSRFRVHGDLRHLDLQNASAAAGLGSLPYDGVVSGPVDFRGSLRSPLLRQLNARVQMSVVPESRGVPVSGRLTALYNGASDSLSIQHSLLNLPHTRLAINGSPGKELNVDLTTTNFDDLLAALPQSSRPPIALNHGQASFSGAVAGHLEAPQISGHFTADRVSIAGRRFDSITADASVSKTGAVVKNGSVSRDAMHADFSGSVGLHDWKPLPEERLSVKASIRNGDLADLVALAGQPSEGDSGQLSANLTIGGTVGNPRGSGTLTVNAGSIDGQPFDHAQAEVDLTDGLVKIPSASIQTGHAHIKLSASYQHPRDSFTTGQLDANIQTAQLDLSQIAALQKARPRTSGNVQLNATVAANISHGPGGSLQFQLGRIAGSASVHGLQSGGQSYGDLTANASTTGTTVSYALASNLAGSNICANGETQLAPEYPTMASATFANLPVQRVLDLVQQPGIPVEGILAGSATFHGTIANPQGSADLSLTKATVDDQPFDRIHARLNYLPTRFDVSQLQVVSGNSTMELTASYDHPAGNLESGDLQFRIEPSNIHLASVSAIAARYPGLAGTAKLSANGTAQIRASAPRIRLQSINGNVDATGLAEDGKNLGDVMLTASTAAGRANFTLNSKLAGANVQGHGAVQLAAGYTATAQLTFKNINWGDLAPLLHANSAATQNLEASADGDATINGPLANVQQLRGSFELTQLQISSSGSVFTIGKNARASTELLRNQGPISATLGRGVLQIQSAHLTGPETNLEASGSVPLNGQSMNVALKGNLDLSILQRANRDITASGQIVLDADVHGTVTQPSLGGQIELRQSSFDYDNLPTGIWKANGVVLLSGNSALIRNLTAEAGGGRVSLTGSATMNGGLRFAVAAHASRVRLQIQPGLAIQASAEINAAGTTGNSFISGTVTLDQVYYASRTDLGSLLSFAAPPVQAAVPSPFLENMRLDLRVRSSSALGVQSSLAQNLQMDADVRIRGTAAHPGVLGRIDITEGKLVFFGSTYTVNTGSISFFNPVRVEPVLNLDLQTAVQDVDVVVKVTGPFDDMKLSYTSNPPLPFQEILSLLATGTTPTSDPTLLANQRSVAPQNMQQMGESALVGAAVANPVANQLQRVFGVSQLKISPSFSSGSQLPAAQIALRQQITSNLTFTYVTGLNTANAQTVQVLWTFTPVWSAQALRDYNGIFSVSLIYKRQFR
jgi:autotransporter translocation and assembly factor TamB